MSFISSLGRTDPNFRVTAPRPADPATEFLSLNDSTVQPPQVNSASSVSSSATSPQQEQDREEAFAKMMVGLQNANPQLTGSDTTVDDDDVGSITDSLLPVPKDGASSVAGKSAADELKDFLSMTPGERILKSMGISEDDLKAMSPEDQDKVMAKVAEILKKQQEMQANTSSGAASGAGGTSASFVNTALMKMTESANDAGEASNKKLGLS